jgi:hypothetical protein
LKCRAPTHRISSLHLDDLEYAKNRIAQYNELPTKAQLLQFIFEVEARIDALESATRIAARLPAIFYDYDRRGRYMNHRLHVEEACRLYSVLPSELDEQSVALLTEDLDNMCRTIFGVWRVFI